MHLSFAPDRLGGEYLSFRTDAPASSFDIPLGTPADTAAYVCSYCHVPYFMSATAGKDIAGLPRETQFFAIKHTSGEYTVFFSLAAELFRTSFYGAADGIHVLCETGSTKATAEQGEICYRITGGDFYALVNTAAESIAGKYGGRLRRDKKPPAFMRYFGWCTWDSFYEKVTARDVEAGLESFREGGFVPRFLLLDDGWQTTSEHEKPRGEWKLSDFRANEKFGGTLAPTVRLAKEKYGVEQFFVWHAVLGYWGGVDATSPVMQKYASHPEVGVYGDAFRESCPGWLEGMDFACGVVSPDRAYDFYHDYHTYLKREGIDGVKIDVQSYLEGYGENYGGRVTLTRAFKAGLERSVNEIFDGNLINCMSCGNAMIYATRDTDLWRSSDDFFPNVPASHTRHIYNNAVNSIWLSPFAVCDWDMFQTAHEYGAYHAAARAISGGPVYVSDRVGEHDFALIRALTGDGGEILPCVNTARPTADTLFADPGKEQSLLKIYNENRAGTVLGVFAPVTDTPLTVSVCPADTCIAPAEKYAAYRYTTGETFLTAAKEQTSVTLASGKFELITYAPVTDGFALLGTAEKLNAGGTVAKTEQNKNTLRVFVRASGTFLFYAEGKVTVTVNGTPTPCDGKDGFYRLPLTAAATVEITR